MDESRTNTNRRRVLGLGAAAVAAASASVTPLDAGRQEAPSQAGEDGHLLTEHVRAAYARMRF